MATSIFAIIGVLIASFIGACGALLLKKGSGTLKKNVWGLLKNYNLILGIGAYAVSSFIFIPLLKYGDLSVLYPTASATYLWVILFSIKFLDEKMNYHKWLGVISIIMGIFLIGLGS
ncbi:MAG: EamA family transporter [Candidatus Woesearchaeota archaeon]